MEGEGMDHSLKKERIKMQPGCLVEAITTSYIFWSPCLVRPCVWEALVCFNRIKVAVGMQQQIL